MMKLKLKKGEKHSDIVASLCWAPNNQLYSLSDDKTILIWDNNAEYVGKFLDLDTYCTAIEWGPGLKSGSDSIALGTSDGTLKVISRNGKPEKIVENAHSTAIICVKWSSDGQAIATSGEDGVVKIWSKQGVLRSKLVESNSPVYSVSWSHDENFMLYASDKNLSIKPILKGGMKTLTWKAHDEIVLCVDWSISNKLIVSGGEDRRYKVGYI
jgi:intraflagellar transport protein 80